MLARQPSCQGVAYPVFFDAGPPASTAPPAGPGRRSQVRATAVIPLTPQHASGSPQRRRAPRRPLCAAPRGAAPRAAAPRPGPRARRTFNTPPPAQRPPKRPSAVCRYGPSSLAPPSSAPHAAAGTATPRRLHTRPPPARPRRGLALAGLRASRAAAAAPPVRGVAAPARPPPAASTPQRRECRSGSRGAARARHSQDTPARRRREGTRHTRHPIPSSVASGPHLGRAARKEAAGDRRCQAQAASGARGGLCRPWGRRCWAPPLLSLASDHQASRTRRAAGISVGRSRAAQADAKRAAAKARALTGRPLQIPGSRPVAVHRVAGPRLSRRDRVRGSGLPAAIEHQDTFSKPCGRPGEHKRARGPAGAAAYQR